MDTNEKAEASRIIKRRREGSPLLGHKARHVLGICAKTAGAAACVMALSMATAAAAQGEETMADAVLEAGAEFNMQGAGKTGNVKEGGSGDTTRRTADRMPEGPSGEGDKYQGQGNPAAKGEVRSTEKGEPDWMKLGNLLRACAAWHSRRGEDGEVIYNTCHEDQLAEREIGNFSKFNGGMPKVMEKREQVEQVGRNL